MTLPKNMSRKTESEMYPLMERWEESLTPRTVFCEEHKIPLSTFSYWRSRYLRSKEQEPSGFVKLEPEWLLSLEIVYPNGVKVRLPEKTSLSDLRTLIELV